MRGASDSDRRRPDDRASHGQSYDVARGPTLIAEFAGQFWEHPSDSLPLTAGVYVYIRLHYVYMEVRLTQRVVDATRPPKSGQVFVRDSEMTGFALRITASGTK